MRASTNCWKSFKENTSTYSPESISCRGKYAWRMSPWTIWFQRRVTRPIQRCRNRFAPNSSAVWVQRVRQRKLSLRRELLLCAFNQQKWRTRTTVTRTASSAFMARFQVIVVTRRLALADPSKSHNYCAVRCVRRFAVRHRQRPTKSSGNRLSFYDKNGTYRTCAQFRKEQRCWTSSKLAKN